MKLNNTQIKTLAQEVLNKIPPTEVKFTKEQLALLTPIVKEINKLEKEINTLKSKQKELITKVYNTELFYRLYDSDCCDLEKMLKKLQIVSKRPTLEAIIHKITLETIFETKESMTDFVNNLVKEYTK